MKQGWSKVNLLQIVGDLCCKDVFVKLWSEVPVIQESNVLRLAGHLSVGNDDLARQGLVAVFDPDLPIDECLPKGEVVTLDALYLMESQIGALDDVPDHRLVRISEEEFRQRDNML